MLSKFDFKGDDSMDVRDIENMQVLKKWTKRQSGQSTAVQFIINKFKSQRMDACLIYFNSGVFQNLPNDQVFNDLNDNEYHQIGRNM